MMARATVSAPVADGTARAVHGAERSAVGWIRLLVVGDTREDVALQLQLLRGSFVLIAAYGGREGCEKARAMQPDVILMDARMQRMDGLAACRVLKADPRTAHIPVIFVSAAGEPRERIEGFRAGAADYVTKPFEPEEVVARIRVHAARGLAAGGEEGPTEGMLRTALKLIRANIARPLPLPDLAHAVGTNEKNLSAAFHRRLGMPVLAWLREERFRIAREMLAGSQATVSQIAGQVGYRTPSNFVTAFRKRHQVTPGEYREAVRPGGG